MQFYCVFEHRICTYYKIIFVLKNARKQGGCALLPGAVSSAKERLEPLEDVVAKGKRLHHHARNVERTFVKVAFGGLRHGAVAMQIAIPFGIILVGQVGIGPLADLLVALQIFVIARGQIGVERSDDGFALRPPELHVLRIVLRRQVFAVAEVDDSAKFLVPSPVPRPIEDGEGGV